MFEGLKNKLALAKTAKGLMTGGLHKEDVIDLVRTYATPENKAKLTGWIAAFLHDQEAKHGCEVAYLIRRTTDGKSAFVDVLELKDGQPIRHIDRYTEKNLDDILKQISNDGK